MRARRNSNTEFSSALECQDQAPAEVSFKNLPKMRHFETKEQYLEAYRKWKAAQAGEVNGTASQSVPQDQKSRGRTNPPPGAKSAKDKWSKRWKEEEECHRKRTWEVEAEIREQAAQWKCDDKWERQAQANARNNAERLRREYNQERQEARRQRPKESPRAKKRSGSAPPLSAQNKIGGAQQALAVLKLPPGPVPPMNELTAAYRKAALLCHPDRPQNRDRQDEATAEFQKVKAAFDLLASGS